MSSWHQEIRTLPPDILVPISTSFCIFLVVWRPAGGQKTRQSTLREQLLRLLIVSLQLIETICQHYNIHYSLQSAATPSMSSCQVQTSHRTNKHLLKLGVLWASVNSNVKTVLTKWICKEAGGKYKIINMRWKVEAINAALNQRWLQAPRRVVWLRN